MKNFLILKEIKKSNTKVEFFYECHGKWNLFMKKNMTMFIDYSLNIENVPDSILVIPFICDILPIAFVFDLNIQVKEIDLNFFNCIDNLREGYQKMYKKIRMGGTLKCDEKIDNICDSDKSLVLFSSGVDAYNTLINHINEKPILFTLWGADIKLDDVDGWKKVEKLHYDVADKLDLSFDYVKTNFRDIINYNILSDYVKVYYKGEWWHEFQHGIAILSHTAPIAYKYGVGKVYIASSFTFNDIGKYTCASDPTIDNCLKFSNCEVIHDGYEYNRQQKIHNICEYMKKGNVKNLDIRVCWESKGGSNCCECEKCYRTILGIIAEKADPEKMGFNFNDEKRSTMISRLKGIATENVSLQYAEIQHAMRDNYKLEEVPDDLKDFYTCNITKYVNGEENVKFNTKLKFYLKTFAKMILKKMN